MPSIIQTARLAGHVIRPFSHAGIPLPTVFGYDPQQPLQVTMDLTDPSGEVTRWILARDLLHTRIGPTLTTCDIRVQWSRSSVGLVFITLSNPQERGGDREAEVCVAYDAAAVRRFLNGTYDLVERGAERVDFDPDAELADLLRRPY